MFSPAAVVAVSGSNTQRATPWVSFDGLSLYFVSSGAPGPGGRDIWFAQRTSTSLQFSGAQPLDGVNSTLIDNRPWLTRDELTLLFVSTRLGGLGNSDIWTATRATKIDPFSNPVILPAVNGTGRDESPVMSRDGLTLYFASDRLGGLGQQDIWMATRPDPQSAFGGFTPMTNLNSSSSDVDIALSDDERELFFASNRSGTPEIWRAIRECGGATP
jgi:hypothetical protein